MRFAIVTLFPEMFSAITQYGVIGRAFDNKLAEITFINPRDFTDNLHRTIDDRPYGGGPGMVMKAEPLALAIEFAKQSLPQAPVCYLSPQGQQFTQQAAVSMVDLVDQWIFVCGRYEGIDQRVIEYCVDMELSIGDYVVSGGEMPVMIVVDAMLRLLPGVLGHQESAQQDSFSEPDTLDCQHYTRPDVWRNLAVPKILLSGDHQAIKDWRHQQAAKQTKIRQSKRGIIDIGYKT